MACNPPYCLGTGDWCGCNCKCCPPTPCYETWTYTYQCGTNEGEWYVGGGPNQGCSGALCVSVPFRAPTMPIEFPDSEFTFNIQDDENGFVFAQAGVNDPACVIPCTTYVITLSTTGCCLYGSGFSFTAIGAGTVTLSPCPSSVCGNFTCDINGGGSSVSVGDCDAVAVTITPPSANCCSCCLIGSAGAAKYSFIGQKILGTGMRKGLISKQAVINRMRKIRR